MATKKKKLLIVESPAKAGTIKKYLGSDYEVVASKGHLIDLPKSSLGIDIENNFEPKYITIRGKAETLRDLKKLSSASSVTYLATDPDREGEAISWHLANALSIDPKSACRVTFNEITKNAVKESIKQPRAIDMNLVDAQQARRVLDRLVGYQISPILWEKVKRGLSAGRVQSVALRIICEREDEILDFKPEEYWTIDASFTHGTKTFDAKYFGENGTEVKLASGEEARKVLADVDGKQATIGNIKTSQKSFSPSAPFTTSTLQQDASRKLNFATSKTMQVAQGLYEGVNIGGKTGTIGLITYMRTDSLRISDDAQREAIAFINETYGKEYLQPRQYKAKKNAQDAHEAIRPTSVFITPDSIKAKLTPDQYKLYKLIWERFTASQMSPAVYDTMSVNVNIGTHTFRANGSKITFAGYRSVYIEGSDVKAEKEKMLPSMEIGDKVSAKNVDANQHFTQPPSRYTEASLVKELEERGIGRPSTYAPTIATIIARGYVARVKKNLSPTELGQVTDTLLSDNFASIDNVDFTAKMEDRLDDISEGKLKWKNVISDFYPEFEKTLNAAKQNVQKVKIKDEVSDVKCSECGRMMVYKLGKFGKFLACPGFPECRNTMTIRTTTGVMCPKCGKGEILVRKSRRGSTFYACENNPKCDFMSWGEPIADRVCPKCSSMLVKENYRGRRIRCINDACDFEEKITRKSKSDE